MDTTPKLNHSKSKFLVAVEKIRQLPPKQLITLALLAAFLPMLVTAALHQVLIGSRASISTQRLVSPPVSPPAGEPIARIDYYPPNSIKFPKNNPIIWKTEHAFLQADSFMIVSEGEVFVGNSDKFSVKSDPPTSGDPNYTTLEVMWAENDQEMRFFAYFYKDLNTWWTNNLRTYDSANVNPDWILFNTAGIPFFQGIINEPYSLHGDMVITSADQRSKIYFKNVRVQAFTQDSIVCAADVKQCDDGTYVPRDPQNGCNFKPCPTTQDNAADLNRDGLVDLLDYNILVVNFGSTNPNNRQQGDLDGNNKIDIFDFNLFVAAFQKRGN